MALVGHDLYIANTDAIMRFAYVDGETQVTGPGEKVADLPAGLINHHWTKNLIANRDGSRLYVTVGSNSNAAENGLDKEERRAAILEVDPATGGTRVFASGLRNPNGMAFEPDTGVLWTVVNERDELGSDLVPDYLTSVEEGGFYGWPFSYYGQHVDPRVSPQRPDLVAKAIKPDYALGNHTASLGLAFSNGRFIAEAIQTWRLHRPARVIENDNQVKSEKSLNTREAPCAPPRWPRGRSYPPARPASRADGAKIDCPCFSFSGTSVR